MAGQKLFSGENLSFRFWNEFKCCHPPPPCSPPRDVPPVARCLTATPPQRSGCPAVPTSLMWRLLLVTFLAGLTHSEPTEEPGALPVLQCSPPKLSHCGGWDLCRSQKSWPLFIGHPSLQPTCPTCHLISLFFNVSCLRVSHPLFFVVTHCESTVPRICPGGYCLGIQSLGRGGGRIILGVFLHSKNCTCLPVFSPKIALSELK